MKILTKLSILLLLFGCASQYEQRPIGPWQSRSGGVPRVSLSFSGTIPSWFAHRLYAQLAQELAGRAVFVDGKGDIDFALTIEPLKRDFTPMFFVVPMVLGFFGCPQGSVTGNYGVRVSETATGRVISVWEGHETRLFGLYRLIPRVERDVLEAILTELGPRISQAVLPETAVQPTGQGDLKR